LQKNFEIEVKWRAFPLHPETPDEGLPIKEVYAARIINIPQAMDRLKKVAEELGLPLGERKKTYNSRSAQELGKWADSLGRGDEFHDAVFRAYFAEGKNIARLTVLASIVKGMGLSEKEAREALKKRSFQDAVDSDWELAYQLGISSVPTFVVDDEAVVGAQPYEVLEQFLLEKGIKRKKGAPRKDRRRL
jgi:predicted DsbA family dithiol-disulfide isomerase